jgi:hypothetical protein
MLVGSGSSPAAVLAPGKLAAENSLWICDSVMGADVGSAIVEIFIALRGLARAKKPCAKFLTAQLLECGEF